MLSLFLTKGPFTYYVSKILKRRILTLHVKRWMTCQDMNGQFAQVKTAEAIYLNGEKTTFGAKIRAKRFYTNSFFEQCLLEEYKSVNECC